MKTRNPFEPREVVSRRGGPAKAPLSRDIVVKTAFELLTRNGAEGMSLRKVAAELDTGAASLYVYVQDLQELQALVLDRVLAAVKTNHATGKPWNERLELLLSSYIEELSRCSGAAQLAMKTIASGPNALRILEALLGILSDAGVNRATAAWAVDLVTLYATAIAFEQSQRASQPDPVGTIASTIGTVSAAEFPRIHESRELLVSGEGTERFKWALQVLLTGILHAPQTQRKTASASKNKKPGK